MYEHKRDRLLPWPAFVGRVVRHVLVAQILVGVALAIGIVGYRSFEQMPLIDALLNSAMLLGGMGPVGELHTMGGKLFASFYALFAGLVFISVAGIVLTPVAHRVLHRLNMD